MAVSPTPDQVQIINHGLGTERQKLLRDTLTGYFALLSKRSKVRRQLLYIFNRAGLTLEQVFKLNENADALFTSFPYDDISLGAPENLPPPMVGPDGRELPPAPPQLRYPLIGELARMADTGAFRHRKLILVGDLYAKIGQLLKSKIPVQIAVFADEARTQTAPPMTLRALTQISPLEEKEEAQVQAELTGKAGPANVISVSRIESMRIADIPFDGVINMPEQGNRFVLKDQTILDTTRKLFTMRGAKFSLGQERLDAENRSYVQAKRVLIVLDEDLEQVISDRLVFDGMQRLWRAHTVEEALPILQRAKAQGIVEYFESEGYDPLLEATNQDERDRLMLQLLGKRLPEFIERELGAAKSAIGALQGPELDGVLSGVPMPVMDLVLTALQNKSMDRFLAFVPVKIRDRVILDFLNKPEHVRAAWRGIGEAERKDVLQTMTAQVLAQLFLTNTQLYSQRFSQYPLEFANTVNSQTVARLRPDEQAQTFSLIAKALEHQKVPLASLQQNLPPMEIERLLLEVMLKRPADAYNRLSPLVRKQIWLTVGHEYRQLISASLHILDKIEIVKGLKEGALEVLFEHPAYVEFVRNPKSSAYATQLFLTLKKFTPGESKSALLKRLLGEDAFRADRTAGVPVFLSAPENKALNQRLSEQIDVLDFRFDSLVCTKANLEPLRTQPALAGAVVILVDNLVDSALLRVFHQGAVSRADYTKLAGNVERELQEMRKRLQEKAAEDPVGLYLLETMIALNEMAGQALSGRLTPAAMQKLDTREELRRKLLSGMKQQVREYDEFMKKAGARQAQLAERIKSTEQRIEQTAREADAALAAAKAVMAECDKIVLDQAKAEQEKNLVSLTQKDLSIEFFRIIQPLILDKLKSLASPFAGLKKLVGIGRDKEGGAAERLIFKFSDAEIEQILRHKVVFCTRDEILLQFVLTCLRIDKLENSLFTIATPDTLPSANIDILFYGPGYTSEDFAARVKEKRMVQFADEAFMKRLLENEELKAKTKQALAELDKQLAAKNAQLGEAMNQANALREKVKALSLTLAGMRDELADLERRMSQGTERKRKLEGEIDVLENRFQELDARFQAVRMRLQDLSKPGGAEQDKARIAEELAAELMKLNEELARLMRIKNVKDVGSFISKSTQQRILKQIELKERYPASRGPVTRVILADDGSVLAQNIKRAAGQAVSAYFRLKDTGLETLSLSRFSSRLDSDVTDDKLPKCDLVLIVLQDPGDHFQALRRLVARVRRRIPTAHPIVLAQLGDVASLDPKGATHRNILGIKERCSLVNLSNADFGNARVVLRLLQDKVPPPAPPAAALPAGTVLPPGAARLPAAQRSSA